jgi:hypothetical protein
MNYEVRWMPRARRQAAAMQRWWVANRESAPTMLRDELARVIGLLQANPELGIGIKSREIRRVLLPTQSSSSTSECVLARSGSRSLHFGARLVNSGRHCRPARPLLDRQICGASGHAQCSDGYTVDRSCLPRSAEARSDARRPIRVLRARIPFDEPSESPCWLPTSSSRIAMGHAALR